MQLSLESRYIEAEPIFRHALQLWSKLGPQQKRNRAVAMSYLGGLLRELERYAASERMLTESLHDLEPDSMPRTRFGTSPPSIARWGIFPGPKPARANPPKWSTGAIALRRG